jgi:hypothetical protein
MTKAIRPIILSILLLVLTAGNALAAPDDLQLKRINDLLDLLASETDLIFVRNGKEHKADRAVSHLRTKLGRAKNKISTCEEFIEHVASKSSISGEPYLIILPDGTRVPAGAYLMGLLKEMEAR